MEALDLARPLALMSLIIATLGYFTLIRYRRARRDEDEARMRADSHQRWIRRYRRLQRHDQE